MSPGTVVFDVLGTLFSLERLREALTGLGAPPDALELWFAQSLRDYFAASHAGGYVPLRPMLEGALPRVLRATGTDAPEAAERVLPALAELEPAPGAVEAVAKLHDAGWTLVALSNGALESTNGLLERAGLRDAFAAVRSCDEAGASKPHPAAYALATEVAGPGEIWMVAAHAWDCAGAARAGLRTAWVSALEGIWPPVHPPPDIRAPDLPGVAAALR
jgi:2-haloacid dehalogenase